MRAGKQPWLYSGWVDGLFILSPPFLCLFAIWLFPGYFAQQHVSVMAWVLLVLLIDVAHVFSTLFRTYLERSSLQQHRQLLYLVPVAAWVAGVLLYSIDGLLFWKLLAYLAVWHFVRQQYGFLQLYARSEQRARWEYRIDTITIYAATLYPLLYWHLEGKRAFNWFVEGDFLLYPFPALLPFLSVLYWLLMALYAGKELYRIYRTRSINWLRNLLIIGTCIAWYVGIITFNGDLVFTLFNVVSHGIPYMALVWIYGRKKHQRAEAHQPAFRLERLVFTTAGIGIFLLLICTLAYIEEGLWDSLVWREHRGVFFVFQSLPMLEDKTLLSLVVPLLALPQVTHYVVDGFIWKVSKDASLQEKVD